MSDEERRTVVLTAGVLLLASLLRFGWEARSVPPILPADTSAYAGLVESTERELADEARRRTPLLPGETIDPNRADPVELARLPGVGPALAERIVTDREANGPFRRLADLERIAGIGPATLGRMEALLDLSDPPDRGTGLEAGDSRLDLNRAAAADLERLPGIGPAMAQRILEARGARGSFRRLEELLEVPGIGPATLERLRPLVTTGDTYVYPP